MNEDAIAQFSSITGAVPSLAAQYLRLADFQTEQAIGLYFANDGAELESSSAPPQSSNPPPVPPASSRPPRHREGYEDDGGIVHLDSDEEDQDYIDDDQGNVAAREQPPRQGPVAARSVSALHTPSSATPPVGASATVDDDEALARRLQEEFYGAAGMGGGGQTVEALDEHGYRAPIAPTRETLVGPDSFDPSNAEEMRAAVMEQVAMRRQQQARHRGETLVVRLIAWTDY